MNHALIEHVAAWLRQVVPDPIDISVITPGSVLICTERGSDLIVQDIGAVLEQPDAPKPDAIVVAFETFLSTVQDFVVEETMEQWPGADNAAASIPRIVVSPAGTIVVGFATSDGWVLRAPIFRFDGTSG